MAFTAEQLDQMLNILGQAVSQDDLARSEWRCQTDAVRQCFVAARIFVDLDSRAVFVDGRISSDLIDKARRFGNVKGFFNKRCHDYKLKSRRVIVFDTVSSRKMGRVSSPSAELHFHGIFEVSQGGTKEMLIATLRKVFGNARTLKNKQYHHSLPDWNKHFSLNGRTAEGPLGKLLYALSHAGSTYENLGLNDGKRSRSTVLSRGSCNRTAAGLARGIPSNFTNQIVICDTTSRRAGEEAFNVWVGRGSRSKSQKLIVNPRPRPVGGSEEYLEPTTEPRDRLQTQG